MPVQRANDMFRRGFAGPKLWALFAAVCLLFLSSCSPPAGSKFLSNFDPVVTLNKIGSPEGIKYLIGAAAISAARSPLGRDKVEKEWTLSFKGSHSQLLKQLSQFRRAVDSQLSSVGFTINGRGEWEGDFSGFSFDYRSGGLDGFIRVSGVSTELGGQHIQIFVFER